MNKEQLERALKSRSLRVPPPLGLALRFLLRGFSPQHQILNLSLDKAFHVELVEQSYPLLGAS